MSPRRGRMRRQELEQALVDACAQRDTIGVERDRLASVLMVVPDAVIVVDADGGEVGRNAAAERFRNARHSDALAETVIGSLLKTALAGDEVAEEVQLHGPPREIIHVRAIPLRVGVQVVGAVVFARDVTEMHRVESVRRDFVANVTHELKTPIGALALLAETMTAGYDPAVMRQLSEQLVREAERLATIVDDLLDLSLIEAQQATREPVAIRALVDEAVDRVHALAQAKRITLRAEQAEDDLMVGCDPRQVVIAVSNLLDNAVKYSDEGASVEVLTSRQDGRIVIEVRDHGIGIPSRDLERVFERFYRVDKARSRTTGGTGLGLSIVRHVAENHGGEVTVESTEGQGSTFRLALAPVDDGPLSRMRRHRDI